jgi:hypothetical protein
LIGYEHGAYALGYIDGGASPMSLLHDDNDGAGEGRSFRPM